MMLLAAEAVNAVRLPVTTLHLMLHTSRYVVRSTPFAAPPVLTIRYRRIDVSC